ncbi:hypothetical protein GCM10010116_19940 [Microbispora rosea subsp. aerata]|nr:hypothetical protein GCM10010116_19940 [Microbispora rosea subsp. aerata]GLJ83072.1 hypothetical protein GCM10017588_17980 [Microbispora rosea subsp. aerata]
MVRGAPYFEQEAAELDGSYVGQRRLRVLEEGVQKDRRRLGIGRLVRVHEVTVQDGTRPKRGPRN